MLTLPSPDSEVGVVLASRLGLKLAKREGHDLAGPCITCKSSDAFRLHIHSGVAQCFSCGGKWSPFKLLRSCWQPRTGQAVTCRDRALQARPRNGSGSVRPDRSDRTAKGRHCRFAASTLGPKACYADDDPVSMLRPGWKALHTVLDLDQDRHPSQQGSVRQRETCGSVLSACRGHSSTAAARRDLVSRRRRQRCRGALHALGLLRAA